MSLRSKAARLMILAFTLCSTVVSVQAQGTRPLIKVRYEEAIRSLMYVPVYIALSKGFLKDEGLDVSMKTSQGTDKGMAALLSGSADIVLIGPEATIYVQKSESTLKTKMFAGNTATDGYFLVSRKKADNFDWNSLKGKQIMTWRPGSAPDIFFATALRRHSLEAPRDVDIVSNVAPVARMGAWLSGQADYGIFPEPNASMLEKDGKGFVVASVGHEVGPVDYTVFTATDAYIEKNPAILQAWTNAMARAQKYARATSSEQVAKDIAQFFPGMDIALIQSSVERNRKFGIWKSTPLIEPAAIEKLQDMLVQSGVLTDAARVKYEDVVVTKFAKNVK
ncbi:MAG: ABC transporter substrate-binding protein [Burkholderiaceae bacterium]